MADNDENKKGIEVPQKYIDMLDNKTVSAEMLDAACYTYNKIAKNYRDEGNMLGRDVCYAKKDMLISAVEPICIHKETYEYRCEIHQSTEPDYENFKPDFDSERTFQNKETGEMVSIGVIERKEEISEPRYYLFYDFGGEHTYHHPLWGRPDSDDLAKYPVKEIDVLHTHGADVSTLLPESFCDQVVDLIASGDYIFVPADNLFEKILSNEDKINERNAESRKEEFEYNGGDAGQCGKFDVESRVEKFESLSEDMKSAINEANLPYGIESMILDHAEYFTVDDIREGSTIEPDEQDTDGSSEEEPYMERLFDFFEERYNTHYADAVSDAHGFDSGQKVLVKEYAYAGSDPADMSKYADAAATLLDLGMTEKEVDGILTDGQYNLIFSPDQSVVIADAYREGMAEDKINVLASACDMNHYMEGSDLAKISACLSDGTDAETASTALLAWDSLSDYDTVSRNIGSLVIPCLEGKIDASALGRVVDGLPEDYNDEAIIGSHSAGEVIGNFLSKGHTAEELEKTFDHILDKMHILDKTEVNDTTALYLDAYAKGTNPELLDACMDANADRYELGDILGIVQRSVDPDYLKEKILDQSGNIDAGHIHDIALASKAGLNEEQMNLVMDIHDQYDPGDHASNEIVLAVQAGISGEDIKSYIGVIAENGGKIDNEGRLYNEDQDYAMACCRIELTNGDGIDKVLDDLHTWINDDRCSDINADYDKIVGYDYEGKDSYTELPNRDIYEDCKCNYYMESEPDEYYADYDEDDDDYWDDDYSEPVWNNTDWAEITKDKQDVTTNELICQVDDIAKEAMESIMSEIDSDMSEYSESHQVTGNDDMDKMESDTDQKISTKDGKEDCFENAYYDPVE